MNNEYIQNYICDIYEQSNILEVTSGYPCVYYYFMDSKLDKFISSAGLQVKQKSTGNILFTIYS